MQSNSTSEIEVLNSVQANSSIETRNSVDYTSLQDFKVFQRNMSTKDIQVLSLSSESITIEEEFDNLNLLKTWNIGSNEANIQSSSISEPLCLSEESLITMKYNNHTSKSETPLQGINDLKIKNGHEQVFSNTSRNSNNPIFQEYFHLVVFCHGNNGSPSDWNTVVKEMKKAFNTTPSRKYKIHPTKIEINDAPHNNVTFNSIPHNLNYNQRIQRNIYQHTPLNSRNIHQKQISSWHILVSKSNSLNTWIGVKKCGEKLAKEIIQYIRDTFATTRTEKSSISFEYKQKIQLYLVGHSLGGLFMRYAIGELSKTKEWKDKVITPCSFNTMCTPHLGERRSKILSSLVVNAYNRILKQTGKDLLLRSSTLSDLTNGDYETALRQFETKTALSLAFHDFIVPYSSSSMAPAKKYSRESILNESNFKIAGFSGFTSQQYKKIFKAISPNCVEYDADKEICDALAKAKLNKDIIDGEKIMRISKEMLARVHSIGWRRLDLYFYGGTLFDYLTMHEIMLARHKYYSWWENNMIRRAKLFLHEVLFKVLWKDRIYSTNFMTNALNNETLADLEICFST